MHAVAAVAAVVAVLVRAEAKRLPVDSGTVTVELLAGGTGEFSAPDPSPFSLAAAGAVDDSGVATLSRDGMRNDGFPEATSFFAESLATGDSSISIARENGLPSVDGFKILLQLENDDGVPVPIADGRNSPLDGVAAPLHSLCSDAKTNKQYSNKRVKTKLEIQLVP